MKRRARPAPTPPSRPFTPEEDEKIAEMVRIGLCCDYYKLGLPDRRFGEILERIYVLQPPRAAPL